MPDGVEAPRSERVRSVKRRLTLGSGIATVSNMASPRSAPLRSRLVRLVTERVAAARRDLAMLRHTFGGTAPPPLVTRTSPRAWPAPRRPLPVRSVEVTAVERPTPDAVVAYLAPVDGAPLTHRPGEFLTLLVPVDGVEHPRAYSIWTAAGDPGGAGVAIKRVAGGLVSNHLNDTLAPGQRFAARGPSGSFVVTPDAERRRHYVLLAGGSGITPLLAILRAGLSGEPRSRFTLLYGNRGVAHVLFPDVLDRLAGEHADRVVVRHVLDEPSDALPCGRGPLGAEALGAELDGLEIADDADTTWLLCGPAPMLAAAHEVLDARGVAPERRLEERFRSPAQQVVGPTTLQPLTVRDGGRLFETVVAPGQTLLEAGVAAGAPLRFSCAMGGCAACRVRLVSGQVAMDEPNCLSPVEAAAGLVLACVARPLTPVVVEVP
ncbi:MAG: hypothetical protein CVU56_12415 [Deltaproteobacteria bacterium HGW-Deltaproteobacteria-14]|jgi:ring-1,2-phenylacetyl-CoA epoxidase subunit PaaE|nr:MAG: hypothetical protein CVU56_12415 [Deltaproteobacteria bacterium HGW-Deltaproteobacteria-14]